MESQRAAGEKGTGFREIVFYRDGTFLWNPASRAANESALIEAYLALEKWSGLGCWLEAARRYADALIDQPEWGIYQGQEAEAVGMVANARGLGTYSNMVGMKLPRPFWMLWQRTGDSKYRTWAEKSGRALLRHANALGIPAAGFAPGHGVVRGGPIGCRIGFALGTLAFLGSSVGMADAWPVHDRMVDTLERLQNPDGSFPQTFDSATGCVVDPSVKNHFFGYVLEGMTQSLATRPNSRLQQMAERLAEFVLVQLDYFGSVPYCASAENTNLTDRAALFFPVADPAPAMVNLYALTGKLVYLEASARIWFAQYVRQAHGTGRLERDGALLWRTDPMIEADPSLGEPEEGDGVDYVVLKRDERRVASATSYAAIQFILAATRIFERKVSAE